MHKHLRATRCGPLPGSRRSRRIAAAICAIGLVAAGTAVATAAPAYAEAGVSAYVTDLGTNSVDVLDTTTNTVTGSIPVGNSPQYDAVSPDGTRVYVSNSGDGTVSVIDASSQTVVATIPVGSGPGSLVVSPDGQSVYVSDANGISVIDTVTDTVASTIVGGGTLALNAAGTELFVGSGGGGIGVIDTATGQLVRTISTGGGSSSYFAVNPAGTQAWVSEGEGIYVADTATGAEKAWIETGPGAEYVDPAGITFSPDGTEAWVALERGGGALEFNTTTYTSMNGQGTPQTPGPDNIALTPDGSAVYGTGVSGATSGGVWVLNGPDAGSMITSGITEAGDIALAPPPPPAATAPAVTGLSPASGETAGGGVVTISGSGFTGATGVDFGTTAAASFTVESDSAIVATAPAGSAGAVDVTVTTPLGTSPTGSADQYTYTAPTIAVTGVSPDSDASSGGEQVTITGYGFTGATAVDFGPMAATSFTVQSDTTITATVPAYAAGTVDVTVTAPTGTSAPVADDQFTYFTPPVPAITGVSPDQGSDAGGNSVTISGSGFTYAKTVEFGSMEVSFHIVNDTTITATSPKATLGTVNITVTDAAGTSPVTTADQYTYTVPPPSVTKLSPNNGPPAGGTTVTITGTGFTGATAVDFGSTPATSFTAVSATSITATAPTGTGVAAVTVTAPTGTSAGGVDAYTYDGADLSTTITTTGTPVEGGYYSYDATMTNAGPIAAQGTSMTISLSGSPGDNILSYTHPNSTTCTVSGQSLTCSLGSLGKGATDAVTVLIEPLGTGAITATSTVSSTTTDTDPGNNTASATADITNADGCTLIGTPGADILTVTADNTVVCDLSGNDTINGAGYSGTTVYLGSGTDTVTVGPGENETVYGGMGADTITSGAGTGNVLYAGDYLHHGAAIDTLHGTHGTTCYASHNDHVYGCTSVIYN
jgi:YVTN family beta-propeller protein